MDLLIIHVFAFLAAVGLGLMTGALLAEGAVLVPFWRVSPQQEFLSWYGKHAELLQKFYGPLEIGAAGTTIVAAVMTWIVGSPSAPALIVASILSLSVLAVFPLYFQRANTGFRTGHLRSRSIAHELVVWSRWHWFRTIMSLAALCASVFATGQAC